jgi:hypothetical protein
MRLVFALSVLAVLAVAATTAPTTARDFKWCARTPMNPSGDCSFATRRQCMATVSGQAGTCAMNPRMVHRGN